MHSAFPTKDESGAESFGENLLSEQLGSLALAPKITIFSLFMGCWHGITLDGVPALTRATGSLTILVMPLAWKLGVSAAAASWDAAALRAN